MAGTLLIWKSQYLVRVCHRPVVPQRSLPSSLAGFVYECMPFLQHVFQSCATCRNAGVPACKRCQAALFNVGRDTKAKQTWVRA